MAVINWEFRLGDVMTIPSARNKSAVKPRRWNAAMFEKGAIRLSFSGVWLKKTHGVTLKRPFSKAKKAVKITS